MDHLEKLTRKRLGEILVAEGLVSKEMLEEAEREQSRTGEPLGAILVDSGHLTDTDLARTVAVQLQLPFLDLTKVSISPDLAGLFDREEIVRYRVVPVDRLGKVVTLAVAEIPDIAFLRAVRKKTGLTPYLFVTTLTDINSRYQVDLAREAADEGGAEGPVHNLDLEMVGAPEGEWNIPVAELKASDWDEVFDTANESVLKDIDREA